MAHLENRQFTIGGKPRLVLAGEIHYFRLKREDWLDRILKAKAANCNAIASYIPWLVHEEVYGEFDFSGPYDLGAFIDLCRDHGLWFIARPGPFTMGEIKNEGLPFWLFEKYPSIVPITWEGKPAESKSVNYLDPDFLRETDRWYGAVMPTIASRLDSKGGNVISVQLDNEIGMLQCWAEDPDLSDLALCDFTEFVQKRRSPEDIKAAYPFDLADPAARAKALRDGGFPTARAFHADYTEFARDRFAKYVAFLRASAEKHGVCDVPFIVNLHGSGGGRATTFPIGISQCYRSYTQNEGYWGSSDHYLGELWRQNVQDLYFLNAFMACVNRPEQPLSSVEFEAGSGDYGEVGVRHAANVSDFKARLSVVQGNRMLNHYLLAGGFNPMMKHPPQDGNGRIGTTGEHHGFAAPIGPTGVLDSTYFALSESNRSLLAVEEHLAVMEEEHDDIAIGFIPDYYSTDLKRPGPMRELAEKLESTRGFLESMTRMMLEHGLSFPAVNLQTPIPAGTKSIALASSEVLHESIQRRLVEFVRGDGRLFLWGRIPQEDMEGRRCTILADALGVTPKPIRRGSPEAFPSLTGVGFAESEPEVRTWEVQPWTSVKATPFLKLSQTDDLVGGTIPLGAGLVMIATSELKNHRPFWTSVFRELGVTPSFSLGNVSGVVVNRLRDAKGQRFISLLNLDHERKEFSVREEGGALFPSLISLEARTAKLLPVGVTVNGFPIRAATTEICASGPKSINFRQTPSPELVRFGVRVASDSSRVEITGDGDGGSLAKIAPGRGEVTIRRI